MKSVRIIEEVDSVEVSNTARKSQARPNPLSPKNNNDLFHIIQGREANHSHTLIGKTVVDERKSQDS